MFTRTSPIFAAGALALTAISAPAQAQVMGIATSNPAVAIAGAKARGQAYQQINQTYATQIQQIGTLRQEIEALKQQLDTNKDKQITQEEVNANQSAFQQIQQKEQQINQLSQPIALAQYYVIEQLLNDYNNAQNEVIKAKKIAIMIDPDVIQYAPDSIDVTKDIVAAIDKRLPSVSTAVPQGWQPRQQTAQVHQAVQQMIILASQQAARQQAQQQQQQGAQAPSGR